MPFERPQAFFTKHRGVRRSFQLVKTLLMFVQPGAKVNSCYYCDIVLNKDLLSDIQKLSGNNVIFHQDDVSASSFMTQCVSASSCARICGEQQNWNN